MPKRIAVIILGTLCLGLAGCTPWYESFEARPALSFPRQAKYTGPPEPISPYRNYDYTAAGTIRKNWYKIIAEDKITYKRSGKVKIGFQEHWDGSVTDLRILTNTMSDVFGNASLRAITNSTPFAPWPPNMARMIGKDHREITFTFNYY